MAVPGIQQMLIGALQQAAENLPPEIKDNILQIGAKVTECVTLMRKIEAQNAEILALLRGQQNGTERFEYPGTSASAGPSGADAASGVGGA